MRRSAWLAVAVVATGAAFQIGRMAPEAAHAQGRAEAGAMATAPTVTLPDFRTVAKRVVPAVVTVRSERTVRRSGGSMEFFQRFFGHPEIPEDFTQRGLGSGVIVSGDGYILTNNHVVAEVDTVEVVTDDGTVFPAEVVGTDPASDLAVLKVKPNGLKVIEMGDSDQLEVGDWVLAVGNPFSEALGATVTHGIVSAKGRSLQLAAFEDFIQTDAAINPGNSGGALVDGRGRLIGINTAIMSRSGGSQGVGFAIPINMARDVMEQLIGSGRVSRGYIGIGIGDVDEDLAEAFGLKRTEGVLVTQVTGDTPAEEAGLRHGDVVLGIDGRKVDDADDLRNRVARMPPGTTIELDLIRDGKRRSVDLTLGERPSEAALTGRAGPGSHGGEDEDDDAVELGLAVQNLTEAIAARLGYEDDTGVVVRSVERRSVAAKAGVQAGDLLKEVNRQRVRNLREYRAVMKARKPGSVVLFYVRRGARSVFVTLRPGAS